MFRRLLISCLIFLLFANVCFAPQIKPIRGAFYIKENWRRNLIALWPFNEGSGNTVSDLSGNNYSGTLNGTSPSWQAGKFGACIYLPETDEYVELVASNLLFPDKDCWTLSIWFNPTTIPAGSLDGRIFTICNGADSSAFILSVGNNNQLQLFEGGTSSTTDVYTISTGLWYHAVVSYDGTDYLVYVNGIYDEAVTKGIGVPDSTTAKIGTRAGAGNDFFNGYVDIPIVYQGILSASKIAQLYREPFCMFEQRAGYLDGVAAAIEYRRRIIISSIQDYGFLSVFLFLSFVFVNRMVRKK